MKRFSNWMGVFSLCLALVGSTGGSSMADYSLETYEFQGQGSATTSVSSVSVATVASGLTGLAFTESGVTPNAAANSINSAGWTNLNAYYQFGFTIQPGQAVTVDEIILTSRSSGTGPGFISLQASVDGGAFKTVAPITQGNATYNDEYLPITSVTAMQSLTFRFVAANQTDAAGTANIGSAGTFRVGDYNPSGTSATPFTVMGTITPLAVPEPSSIALTALGVLFAAGVAARRTR